MNETERAQAAALPDAMLRKQVAPYTQLPTAVIQSIQNPDALALWAYLHSKSSNWRILKNHLRDHFDLSRERYAEAMRVLKTAGLVSDHFVRDAGNRIVGRDLILNLEPCIPISVRTESPTDGKHGHSYETQENSTKEKSLTKPPSPRKRGNSLSVVQPVIGEGKYSREFEEFWDDWPKGKGGTKAKAYKAWLKLKLDDADKQAERTKLHYDVQQRKAYHRPWQEDVVCHVATYLNGQGWTADIDTSTGNRTNGRAKTSYEQVMEASERNRAALLEDYDNLSPDEQRDFRAAFGR